LEIFFSLPAVNRQTNFIRTDQQRLCTWRHTVHTSLFCKFGSKERQSWSALL